MAADVCVWAASPRVGSCARMASAVARGLRDGGSRPYEVRLADYDVLGCTGCGACERTGSCVLAGRPTLSGRPGFDELLATVDAADALLLVAPVFFAGPPSQLKAFLDRLQPFWAQRYLLKTRAALAPALRRPFELAVVGSGGDPFGYDPLVTCCRSALRMADFELQAVHDFVGDCDMDRAEALGRDFAQRLGRSLQ